MTAARLKKKGPVPISDILSVLLPGLGEETLKRERMTSLWCRSIGKKESLHTEISAFGDGILTILIDSSSSLYELSLKKELILQKLQKEFGKNEVREIRFQIGRLTRE